MSAADPETLLRTAIIAAAKASADLQATAMGASPRVFNQVPGSAAFPFAEITSRFAPWDVGASTGSTGRGGEHSVEIRIEGEYEGSEEGNKILWAFRNIFIDWSAELAGHRVVNTTLQMSDVRQGEDAKRYVGLQAWRIVTEETG